MEHERYRKLFAAIDDALWHITVERRSDGFYPSRAKRSEVLEDTKKILTAYIDISTDRMQKLLADEAFARFPLSTKEESNSERS